MTWLLVALWLIFTGFNLTMFAPGVNVDTGSDEYQRNYIEYQRQIIVEDYFTFATELGNYNYVRWCAWGYWPDRRDTVNQKWVRCSKKSFDCGGVIKAYGFIKWILDRREVGHNNSRTLYDFGQPISPEMAQRWDYTYWELVAGSGLAATHGAFVSEPLLSWYITIFDGLGWKFHDRELRLWCDKYYCTYNTTNGKYRIKFSTNPLYEIAMTKWVEVQPFEPKEITWDTHEIVYRMGFLPFRFSPTTWN